MLNVIECTQRDLLKVEASGKLTRADHVQFLSCLEGLSQEYGRVRLLVELKGFRGLEPDSAWEDPTFSLRVKSLVKRLAIIGEEKELATMKSLGNAFTEVCLFTPQQREDAYRWVSEGYEEDVKERIRKHAYLRWEKAGKPVGDPARFWIEAERELCESK